METNSSWHAPGQIGERGLIFTLDAAIACSILLLSLFVSFCELSAAAQSASVQASDAQMQLFAASLSETIVKNRDTHNPSRGAAYFNEEKNRVEQNVLDEKLLRQISETDFGNYSLFAIYERDFSGKKYYFGDTPWPEKCIAVERFAAIASEPERKSAIGVVVCEK